ncbi:molybdopterin synthase catalytic subunit MoaE [Celerinatantimonas diazotrophica]|uniref:Molybdopterin synthase catalytic subunit n=1 Tax=Celerinatantimonas diazotrophica TaxID=412034 RepID=A0A4R1JAR2_9GAMM|nr:molybdopterin synthase catalytic subunit MoaE [Celerinatantimonas diazotrophica]TCK47594.1 molybdopterin synthase subunit MoaE [Celerinatantimonas diazotrophica]CAG9296783.1 Molybdopterin synthase catalytic subunit [Celerinatantimonas diazotrophica]
MIKIQQEDFNVGQQYTRLANNPEAGAIVFFVGCVRDMNQDESVSGLFLEHYPDMTEKVIEQIVSQAQERWHLSDVNVVHRVGQLEVNEQIVFVGVSAAHRNDAFAGAEFIMDKLKTAAPFWKKENRQGKSYWLEQRQSDVQAANKWDV